MSEKTIMFNSLLKKATLNKTSRIFRASKLCIRHLLVQHFSMSWGYLCLVRARCKQVSIPQSHLASPERSYKHITQVKRSQGPTSIIFLLHEISRRETESGIITRNTCPVASCCLFYKTWTTKIWKRGMERTVSLNLKQFHYYGLLFLCLFSITS